MIRPVQVALAALVAAAPAFAEGGRIRSGEHVGFSRIVMVVEPTTEWSLEIGPGRATVFFPDKALAFGTDGVFAKIPRTRITGVATEVGPEGTRVDVEIGCDCRISTSFVGATYLALDVADRDAPRPTAQAADPQVPPEPIGPEPETAAERTERETAIVANAEAALIAQIERAARQGLIDLDADDPADAAQPTEVEPLTLSRPRTEPAPPEPAQRPAPPAPQAAPAPPEVEGSDLDDPEGPFETLLAHDQIEATTVFDRDRQSVSDRLKQAAVPLECLPDARLDVGAWSNGRPFFEQRAALATGLVGEFDRPEPEALATLARLYIRFGFGLEAEQALGAFAVAVEDGALLRDLARAVERRPVAADGPLALVAACPGNHGLWLALGGVAPAFHDATHFASVHAAFAEMPPDLRALVGPALVDRLLDADRTPEARLIYDTTQRPGFAPSVDMRLAAARLAAAEGEPGVAVRALDALVDENAPNAAVALTHLVALAREAGLPVPPRTVLDLRAAVVQNRGTELEPLLRARLVVALAAVGALPEAVAELRAARGAIPEAPALDGLAADVLGGADPTRVGAAIYADVVLGSRDLLDTTPASDPARLAVGRHLIETGLPHAAAEIVAPAAVRDDAARLVLGQALVRAGEPTRARRVLTGLDGPDAAATRARALALEGDFVEANAALAAPAAGPAPYAWPSGDWDRARTAAPRPEQRALAEYMASREARGAPRPASAAPETLPPPEAIAEPLPSLERPSLASARRLLATGRQVGDFVETVLTDDPARP